MKSGHTGRSGLTLLFDSVPEAGESRPVCEAIEWVQLPLPFALNHVNCWLLGEPGDQTLIDTGVATSSTRKLWQLHWGEKVGAGGEQGLASAPEQLLVTHFHPDHSGLAGWFSEAGSALLGSAMEMDLCRDLCATATEDYVQAYVHWYTSNGLPQAAIDVMKQHGNAYRRIVQDPPGSESWTYLSDGQCVNLAGQEYQVMIGRGHAPDMLMLYRAADHVLIAADQILPTISPNVSVMPRLSDANPLQSFLQTLHTLKCLPEDTLVLPSHGVPFRGLHRRIAVLEAHHEERLQEVLAACAQPRSAFDLFSVLFRRELDAQQMSFALGESLAHLHYLEHQGALLRQGSDGVVRFVQS